MKVKNIFGKVGQKSSSYKLVLSSLFITLAAVGGFLLLNKAPAYAAACAPTTSYGTDTVSFSVTTAGTYTAWVRLLSPDGTNNQIMMNVDNGTCVTMGATMPANTWTWVDTTAGSSTPVTMTLSAGTHSVVFTGNEQGVELDEVQFLTDSSCVPSGTTNNCTVNQATPPTVSISTPTAGSTVSGTTPVTAIANDSVGISQVEFEFDGVPSATDTTSPYSVNWNTTSLAAGSHTITVIATNTAGLTATATEQVTVNNNQCTGNPTAPSNLHDTDTAPLPASKVDLGWTAGSPAANCTLSGYNIYRNGSTTALNATPVNAVAYTDSTVAASTTYTYQIAAVDTSGHVSTKVPATPLSVTTGVNCAQGSGVPTTPTNLAMTANNYTTINFSWTASTVNDGCTLSGYHVYRNGGTTPIATITATNYQDTGLTSGTNYTYTVNAFDSGGNVSANSAVGSFQTVKDNVAPSMPTGLTGNAPSAGAVNLSWTGSTDLPNPGAVGVAGYDIYRNDSTTPSFTVNSPTTTTFSDSTVAASTTYKYAVAAFDKNGNISSETADISVTTPAPTCSGNPTVPGTLHATGSTVNSISLAWTASTPSAGCTIQGYQVLRGKALITTVTGTSFTDTGLAANTNYVYDIVAVDTSGHQATTADFTTATAADTTAPSTPTNFTVSAPSPTQVTMGWTASTDNVGVTGYNIYRNTALIKTVGVVTTYTDTTVSPNTTYTYQVAAVDAAGNVSGKASSTPITITTPQAADTTPPSTPGKPTASVITANSVALSWAASTDNVAVAGYNVLRNGTQVNSSLVTATNFTDSGLAASTSYTYTIVAVDTSGNKSTPSSALSVTTSAATSSIPGDINNDNAVNVIDFNILLTHFGKTVPANTLGDLYPVGTGDGQVTIQDLNVFLIDWGTYIKNGT